MRKGRILNRALNDAISAMGHGDIMVLADVGYPIPETGVIKVDLALTHDVPDIYTILELICEDFIYEKCVVAKEQEAYNKPLHSKIKALIDRCEVETMPHEKFMPECQTKAKVVVRSGSLEPWGNIMLVSGIDAPTWFAKEGVITPDYYEDRANYEG